ncbi:cell division protein ZapC domain-containing protein [Oceanisphaera sp. KMM 10153]|uniref:cell division protein ZapC domain-containing protein n=1 Tax=Oceanisphaera submarina TaxID=3390193 RepID=UPI0039753A1E
MILQPNDGWRWFMGEDQHLMLDLGAEMLFSTPYIKKQLVCSDNMDQCFSVEDTGLYYRFLDKLGAIGAPAQRVQAALNGIAIARFYKPLMPQSWFFEPQADYHQPQLGELIALDVQTELLTLMVVETSPSATVCMSLSAEQLLAGTKQLSTFGAIKVMNDRIISLEASCQEEEIRKVG